MIETHHSHRINEAQRIAHKERGAAFASLFRAIPKIVSSLRHRG